MALGALTLPSVNTPFTSGSKALVPYSPPSVGVAQKMSPLETMQEVFYDIRDGINNLGEIFSEKISGLNSHLAFRLEAVSFQLQAISHNIGALAYMQEQEFKGNLPETNDPEDERGESLGEAKNKKDPSKGMIATLREGFSSITEGFSNFVDKLTPKSDLGKVGLYGLLAIGLFTQLDKLTKIVAPMIKYFDEKIIPKVKEFWSIIKEDFAPIFDNIVKFFKEAFDGIGDLLKGAFEGDAGLFLSGIKKIMFDLPIRLVSIIGDAFFSLVDAALKTFGIDAPWVEDIATAFRTLPEAIDKVITDTMKFFTDGFDKLMSVYTEDGLIGAVGEGFRMFYDNTIGLGLNLLYDMYGAILKLFGAEELGEWFQNADFSFDGIKNAFNTVTDKIKGAFDALVNGMKAMANAVIDKINILLPKKFEIKKLDVTETMVESADGSTQVPLKEVKTIDTPPGLAERLKAEEQIKTQEFNETYVDKIVKEQNTMKIKEKELVAAASAKVVDEKSSSPIIIDNKNVNGGTTINTAQHNHGNANVNHSDPTANAILNILYNK